jgi:hypothetical protein
MVSIGFLSLRLLEPVVEEVKVTKQMLADAEVMAAARFKSMTRRWLDIRIGLLRLPSVPTGNLFYCCWELGQLGEGVVCVCVEGVCVAGWTHEFC